MVGRRRVAEGCGVSVGVPWLFWRVVVVSDSGKVCEVEKMKGARGLFIFCAANKLCSN